MSKKADNVKLTISISPKLDTAIRITAVKNKVTLSELLERCYEAYLRELEREKAEKVAKTKKDKES
jgi:hypothetical protein